MSSKKGTGLEKEAMEVYNKWGYQTWKPANASVRIGTDNEGRPRYINRQQDIASAFDFIAWDDEEVHLVQVKNDEGNSSRARKKIEKLNMAQDKVVQVVLMRIFRKKRQFTAWVLISGKWDRQNFNEDRMIDNYQGYDHTEDG